MVLETGSVSVRLAGLVGFALLCTLPGCKNKTNEAFTPSSGAAQSALTAALNSWKAGQAPGTVAGTTKPTIQVVDSEWEKGGKLADYEILSDDGAATGPRIFKVRLKLATGQPREVMYMVVGIDPLWVYRDTDFAKLSGAGP